MKKQPWLLLAVLILITLFPQATTAQVPEKRPEFVYGVNAFTGLEYESVFYPLTVDTIYLMANVTNIISPRQSLVYFWPITNEQRVDWDGLNETIEGTLEIVQSGQVIQRIPGTKYVIQYPKGFAGGEVYVYLGEEAEAQYEEFDRQRWAFRDEVAAYYEASRNYRQDLEEKSQQGPLEDEPPPPPVEPDPFLFISTGVFDGIPLNLPPGNYKIQLRAEDGQIVPDSERKLVAFNPERDGVGYAIIPHDKWTTPDQSDDPSQILYGRRDSIIYLQPFYEKEYNDLYLSRLQNPQSTSGQRSRWRWAELDPIEAGYLEIVQNGRVVDRINRKPYVVRQYTGSALGYEILDQETVQEERFRTRTPDFEGYPVKIAPDQASFSLRLVDLDGKVLPGSERQVKLVETEASNSYYLLPLAPLIIGGGLALWRRRKLATLSR